MVIRLLIVRIEHLLQLWYWAFMMWMQNCLRSLLVDRRGEYCGVFPELRVLVRLTEVTRPYFE